RAVAFLGEDLLEDLAASLEQVVEGRYDADRDDVVVLRDVPEPALAVGRLQHHRRALVAPGVAVRPFEIAPDGALVEDRIPHAQPQAVGDQAVLAAGVDHDLPADLAVLQLHAHGAPRPDRGRGALLA